LLDPKNPRGFSILTFPSSSTDNLHITETRLILLDGALILFLSMSLLSYIKFHQLRYRAFSAKWWKWLLLTGFFLACTLGCKMVGLLTFCTIGTAVVWDLWQLMDIKRPNPMTMVSCSLIRSYILPLRN